MTNRRKKGNITVYFAPLLILLLLLYLPALNAKAENLDAANLNKDKVISVNDSIVHPSIEITYYDFEGKYIAKEKGTDSMPISRHYDPRSGADYERYIITALNISSESISISLEGISDKPALIRSLEKLIVKTPPTKTIYTEGETFNKNGMVVMVCYDDGSWRDVTGYTITPNNALSKDTKYVTIRFTENDKTVTTTQSITVNAKDSDSYIISARAAAGGSISDAGNSFVKRGDGKTYTISPNKGYRINYVEVDGDSVGAVSSYTFDDIRANHSISAYFLLDSTAGQNNAAKKKLTVIGSFSGNSGAGNYAPGTKVTIDAGAVPGFAFAGWIASDGIIYPMPTISYVMPAYDILLYANWIPSGTPNALNPVTTTNLKEPQLSGWTEITNKLATFNANDLAQPGNPIMKVAIGGINCYVDAAPIAMLNTRHGTALEILYGADASFTFYSDVDNSQFTGTDLSYTCSANTNLFFREKKLVFAQPGAINTGICLNVSLPDAQTGQIAYVYLINENGSEIMYLPVIVDSEQKVTIPISAKVNLCIKY